MTRKRTSLRPLVTPTIGGLIAGVALGWFLTAHAVTLGSRPVPLAADGADENSAPVLSKAAAAPLPVRKPVALETSPTSADAISDLRHRHLLMPIAGVEASALHDSFHDARDRTRQHEALDILAPRNTEVRAVENGTIAKLFFSKAGGITLYQFDPTETYAYYYAHLERYAPGLQEHQAVLAGQVIGFVGTSGNAPPNTPHLHFAIFKLTPDKHWWQGTAINPFDVLR